MPDLAKNLAPLSDLLKKGVNWKWTSQHDRALRAAKESLSNDTTLIHYSPDLQVVLSCDASQYGLGAVLAHRMPEGGERPIAYASCKLNQTEQNYSQIEKEGLAAIYGLKKFHHYGFC